MTMVVLVNCSSPGMKIDLSHLDYLGQDMEIDGRPCRIIHIYCNAPDYHWTDADNEGISCVDDVARAAIVYIKAYELEKKTAYLENAHKLLNFILVMQAEDGEFYNFIHADGSINRNGITSKKSFQFWAARGYWALGEGVAFFKDQDADFAEELETAFLKCRGPIGKLLVNDQQYITIGNRTYPRWLMQEYAGDATAELLLGITAYLQTEYDSLLAHYSRRLGEGILEMQISSHPSATGAFESWPGYWHAWGNAQVQALTAMYQVFREEKYLNAAESSAQQFLSRVATGSVITEIELDSNFIKTYPQIAYDIRTTALGLLDVHKATGKRDYAVLAGIAASWLTGNNVTGQAMYNPSNGRIFDGIDPKGVNYNAGAESTIEGLYTLVEIYRVKEAMLWLNAMHNQTPFASGLQDYSVRITNPNSSVTFNWNARNFAFTLTCKK